MRRVAIGLVLAVFLAGSGLRAGERSAASFVPADAFFTLYYDGSHRGFKETTLYKFFQEPEVLEAAKGLGPTVEWLRREIDRGAEFGVASSLATAAGCELALAVFPPAEPGKEPIPLIVARVGIGEDAARREAERLLKWATDKAEPGSVKQIEIGQTKATSLKIGDRETLVFGFEGPFVLLTSNEATLKRALDPATPRAALATGDERPVLGVHYDHPALFKILSADMEPQARAAFDAFGFNAIQSADLAFVPRGKRLVTQFEIAMPDEAKRVGLARWFADCPPFDPGLLKMVPARPALFWLSTMDVPGLWDAFWASLAATDAGAADDGRKAIAAFEAKAGVQIRNELLGSLGRGTLLVMGSYGGWLNNWAVFVQRVRDAKTLETGLTKLANRFDLALAELDANAPAPTRAALKSFTYRGHTCHYLWMMGPPALALPGWAISYTNLGDTFVFAPHPLYLKAYLDFLEDKQPTLLDDAEFNALRPVVPQGATSIAYGTWPETMVGLYNTLAPFLMVLQGIEGVPPGIDLANLPSSRLLRRYAQGGISYSIFENGRYRVVAQGEGLDVLGPQMVPVSGLAIAAGMVLPALARARQEARLIRDRNNLNMLCRGCATYLNEFGDNRRYPASIAELFDKGIIPDKQVFVSPLDDAPPKLKNGLPCSYEFIFDKYPTRQILDDFPPNVAMGWDRKAFVPGRRSVLFFDSHVEVVDDAGFARLLEDVEKRAKQVKERPPAKKEEPKGRF